MTHHGRSFPHKRGNIAKAPGGNRLGHKRFELGGQRATLHQMTISYRRALATYESLRRQPKTGNGGAGELIPAGFLPSFWS
jgi:hypothetical protein